MREKQRNRAEEGMEIDRLKDGDGDGKLRTGMREKREIGKNQI